MNYEILMNVQVGDAFSILHRIMLTCVLGAQVKNQMKKYYLGNCVLILIKV